MAFRLLALLSLAAVAACAPRAEPAPQPAAQGPLVPSLQVETFADSVRLVLQVTNVSTAAVPVTFSSGQSFDFSVEQNGRELWRWSADRGFTQAVRQTAFAPGETQRFEASWRRPAGTRGALTARGVLTSTDRRVEQAAPFTLP